MKQLKDSLRDLREIFERSITVRDVAEPLASFDGSCSVNEIKKFMDEKDFDVIGVRRRGLITGYANRKDLFEGKLDNYLIDFEEKEIFAETTPLIDIFLKFRIFERIFVRIFGGIGGIVTRGDFQKIPLRMWLFGLISLLEMNLLRIIRECYPQNEWFNFITIIRLDKAKEKCDTLHEENAGIDLAECLEFCDKRDIIIKNENILKKLNLNKNDCNKLLKNLEKLRNKIAHSGYIDNNKLLETIELTIKAEAFLRKCEEI
jgi:hypothetical protein